MSFYKYNEFKFGVSDRDLSFVITLLEELYGGSDPYALGEVDSLYYDTLNKVCLNQCLDGSSEKVKFRLRGYGDGSFNQIHQKSKSMFRVGKYKAKLVHPVRAEDLSALSWYDMMLADVHGESFQAQQKIDSQAAMLGPMFPALRVKYSRRRYRIQDYRVTLDYNVRVSPYDTAFGWQNEMRLPGHVLEVKTELERPYLPLLGLAKLQQVSFSKYQLANFYLTSNPAESIGAV